MTAFIRFLKDWTLPVAMLSGSLIYLLFAFTPALDDVATRLAPVCDQMLPFFMFIILFITFCKVDFRKLIPVRWHLWTALQQTALVALLVILILWFRMSGHTLILTEAVLTCIIGPCAAAAPVVTSKLGGNLEEMTTYTFLSNFLTALLIPICFPMIDKAADISFIAAFLKILNQVCIVLLLPMLLAFVVKHTMRRFHQWIVGVKDLSYYLWGCSLMLVTGTTVKNIVHADSPVSFLLVIAGLTLMLCIAQFATGRFIGHYFDATIEAGQALGQKNTAFAIWIAYTYLSPLSSVGPGCYILWQNIVNSMEIWKERKKGNLHAS